MRIVASALTDTGLVREANEDSYLSGETVFGVADGLGGHVAGEVASGLAIGCLTSLDGVAFDTQENARTRLADAVASANRAVLTDAEAHPDRMGMGTTLTAALVHSDVLLLAHVGDSRAYLRRDAEGLRQLTTDHTAVAEAVAAGSVSASAAGRHPARHTLTRAVGLDPDVEVETPEPVALVPGDRVLLCSDGLTEVVGDDELAKVLGDVDPEQACASLVRTALERGGPDNVTVVVVGFEDDG